MLVGSTTTALKTFMPCDSNFHHTPPARPGTGPGPRPRAPGRAPALGPGPRARGRFLGVRVPFLVCVWGGIPQHSCWFHPGTVFLAKKCFLLDFLPGTIFYISRWDPFLHRRSNIVFWGVSYLVRYRVFVRVVCAWTCFWVRVWTCVFRRNFIVGVCVLRVWTCFFLGFRLFSCFCRVCVVCVYVCSFTLTLTWW